jgi:hypothetical protein
MQYTTAQRKELFEYWQELQTFNGAAKKYSAEHGLPPGEGPSANTVKRLVEKFNREFTLLNVNKGRSGRQFSVRIPENILRVNNSVQENPERSLRKRCQALDLKKSSLSNIIRKDLGLRAYKMQKVHSMNEQDYARRLSMCQKFQDKIQLDDNFLKNVILTDEAHAYLDGGVTANLRHYSKTKPSNFINQKKLV